MDEQQPSGHEASPPEDDQIAEVRAKKPVRRRTKEGTGKSSVRLNDQKTQSQYEPYKEAAWGFINHWYPAVFSSELQEDQVEGVQICGIPIVLRRVDGQVYALKDRCVHRGVRMSAKPMCFNKETISCSRSK